MLLVSYIQQYFNTPITVLTNQVWKLLIALFKVPNTGAFTVHVHYFLKYMTHGINDYLALLRHRYMAILMTKLNTISSEFLSSFSWHFCTFAIVNTAIRHLILQQYAL